MRDVHSKHRDGASGIGVFLFLLIGTPAAALGAVHATVAGVYFTLAAAFLGYLFVIQKARPPKWDLPTVAGLSLIAFTGLQLVPLPSAIVSVIAPSVYEIRSRAAAPLGLGSPSFMPLTLDEALTMVEAGKLLLYLSVYWGAVHITKRFGEGFVLRIVVAAGVLGAAVLLVHKILMLDRVYGFYTPLFVTIGRERMSAPLVNENHMAAFLGMCALAAVGRAAGRSDRMKRIAGYGTAAFLGGALMLTLSRGGIAAFAAAQCLFIVIRGFTKRSRFHRDSSDNPAWLLLVLALSLGLGLFAAQNAIIGEFLDGNIRKIDLFFEGLPLAERFWTTGVGRGAFWVGFHLVSGIGSGMTVTHAENAPVQLLADWGVFVGAAALAAAAWMVGRFLLSPPRSPERAAAVAALVGFGIHNLVDFNMEIPGVAVIAAALLGVLYGGESFARSGEPARAAKGWIWGTALAAVAAGIAAIVYAGPHSLDTEERRFQKAFETGDATAFSTSALRRVLKRHPAAAYLPFLNGVRLYHLGTENPLPWLARAVELYPRFAEAHFYIGGTLLRAGRFDQGMLELRLAVRAKPNLARAVAVLLVSRAPRFDEVSKAAVTERDKELLWPALARELSIRGSAEEAERADAAVLSLDPSNRYSATRQVRRLTAREDFKGAELIAQAMISRSGGGVPGTVLLAEVYEKSGDSKRAVVTLEQGLAQFGDRPSLLRSLAWARIRGGDFDGALEAATLLKARSRGAEARARAAILAAELHLADHRIHGALASLREALIATPGDAGILRRIFLIADKHGEKKHALEALRQLARLRPGDEPLQKQLKMYEKSAPGRKPFLESDNF